MTGHYESPHVGSGVRGALRLRFAESAGRTILAECDQQPPLRVVRAFLIANGGALVHLHNLSGGVLGGDRLELSVEAGPRSVVQITTTGATRVYRSRHGADPAHQHTRISVAAGGLLEYLPDPVIPYAGSRYGQTTHIELAEGAGLTYWDTLAPGREAHGEIFDYDLLQSSLTITALGTPIALERFCLEPRLRPLTSPARMGAYRYLTGLTICRVGLEPARWLDLEAELTALAQQLSDCGRALWGVSTLPAHGLTVRGLCLHGRDITSGLLAFWRASCLALDGRTPVPPRKVN